MNPFFVGKSPVSQKAIGNFCLLNERSYKWILIAAKGKEIHMRWTGVMNLVVLGKLRGPVGSSFKVRLGGLGRVRF